MSFGTCNCYSLSILAEQYISLHSGSAMANMLPPQGDHRRLTLHILLLQIMTDRHQYFIGRPGIMPQL